jgi:hypothetical protein
LLNNPKSTFATEFIQSLLNVKSGAKVLIASIREPLKKTVMILFLLNSNRNRENYGKILMFYIILKAKGC